MKNEVKIKEVAAEPSGAASLPKRNIAAGIGPTNEFNLRISTAVLTCTHFRHPDNGIEYLVLERKCSCEVNPDGSVKTALNVQPLGGASVLRNPLALWEIVGAFNYDSEASKKENDFRIQIRTSDWEKVRDFCLQHFRNPGTGVIEADVARELREEFEDALKLKMPDGAYRSKNKGIVVQEEAEKTERLGVTGAATKRVFNIHDVEIISPELISAILKNSSEISGEALQASAREKALTSPKRKAKATALTALPRAEVEAAFSALGEAPAQAVSVQGHKVIATVAATLMK